MHEGRGDQDDDAEGGGGAMQADDPPRRGAPAPLARKSIWDHLDEEDAEGDLWSILRLIDEAESPVDGPAAARSDADPADWLRAEAALGRPLADAAAAFARLDERLRAVGPRRSAAVERLAQGAALDLLRREGVLLAPDRLALWLAGRAASGDAGLDLARAGWATRRLIGGAEGLLGSASLRRFLGLKGGCDEDDAERASRQAALAGWADAVRGLRGAHRLTQAAFGLAAWSAHGLSRPGATLEGGVLAAVLAARAGRGGAPFAPPGRPIGRNRGVEARLAAFLAEVEAGSDASLATIERLVDWEARAQAGVADLSGRTPRRLVDAVARRFAISAAAAAAACDVSVSAAARNLALMQERGLLREMTGRGRFRLWSARL